MKLKRVLFGVLAVIAIGAFVSCNIPEEVQDEITREFVDPTKIKPPTDG